MNFNKNVGSQLLSVYSYSAIVILSTYVEFMNPTFTKKLSKKIP